MKVYFCETRDAGWPYRVGLVFRGGQLFPHYREQYKEICDWLKQNDISYESISVNSRRHYWWLKTGEAVSAFILRWS